MATREWSRATCEARKLKGFLFVFFLCIAPGAQPVPVPLCLSLHYALDADHVQLFLGGEVGLRGGLLVAPPPPPQGCCPSRPSLLGHTQCHSAIQGHREPQSLPDPGGGRAPPPPLSRNTGGWARSSADHVHRTRRGGGGRSRAKESSDVFLFELSSRSTIFSTTYLYSTPTPHTPTSQPNK